MCYRHTPQIVHTEIKKPCGSSKLSSVINYNQEWFIWHYFWEVIHTGPA